MKKENMEYMDKMVERLGDLIKEFKGGPFIKIKVVGHLSNQRIMGGGIRADFDIDDQLKNESKSDAEIYRKSFYRIIKKGNIETAWDRKPAKTVVGLGFEFLIIDEKLEDFCKRVGWEIN